MRKTWCSSKTDSTCRLSSTRLLQVVPNGFSMMTRTSASSTRFRPCSPRLPTITGKNVGAVER